MKTHLEPFCFVDGAAGIYVPRYFARRIDHNFVEGVTLNSWAILGNGPEDEAYWDTWSDVLDNAVLTDKNGDKWTLYQDGDLFCVPVGMEWDEDRNAWVWAYGNPPEGYIDYELPEYWASYLINGDASGLEDGEQEEIDAFLAKENVGHCVDCSGEAWFANSNDAGTKAGGVLHYRFCVKQ